MPKFILTSHAEQRWQERVGSAAPQVVLVNAMVSSIFNNLNFAVLRLYF